MSFHHSSINPTDEQNDACLPTRPPTRPPARDQPSACRLQGSVAISRLHAFEVFLHRSPHSHKSQPSAPHRSPCVLPGRLVRRHRAGTYRRIRPCLPSYSKREPVTVTPSGVSTIFTKKYHSVLYITPYYTLLRIYTGKNNLSRPENLQFASSETSVDHCHDMSQ